VETAQINRYIRVTFVLLFFVLGITAFLSEGIFDTGDGILHYQIARWSWKHPELFLHHWGKPVFTLIASPFAQFGYKGVVLFNMTCHIGVAWLTWRIAVRMKLPYATLAPFLVVFAPISWGVWQSGLTEPLFAATLMSGIYFVIAGRYRASAIVLSLLPFVRTEGFLLLPLFGIYFLMRRDFIALLLVGAGTLIYSIVGGMMVYHDFLWVIHGNPYKGEANYGSGSLFYFISQNEFLFGWLLTALIGAGSIALIFRNRGTVPVSLAAYLLIGGSFAVFFTAHSIFWWKGLFGSYGLIRVMACIVPCGVLIGIIGLGQITRLYAASKAGIAATLVAVFVMTSFNAINQHGLVRHVDEKQRIVFATAESANQMCKPNNRIFYGYPLITHALDADPFDTNRFYEMWGVDSRTDFRSGDLVVWDSHLGPLQYNLSEQHLLAIPRMKEVYRSEKGTDGNNHYFVICRYE